jgi:hypothetical protein
MTTPPYPTENEFFKQSVAGLNIFPFEDPPIDTMIGLSVSEMMKLKESISYWLTPRKCAEVPPEYPCLVWGDGKDANGKKIVFENICFDAKDWHPSYTHWLPFPPAPEES